MSEIAARVAPVVLAGGIAAAEEETVPTPTYRVPSPGSKTQDFSWGAWAAAFWGYGEEPEYDEEV